MKKLIALLMALVLIAAMAAGCSAPVEEPNEGEDEGPKTNNTVPSTDPGEEDEADTLTEPDTSKQSGGDIPAPTQPSIPEPEPEPEPEPQDDRGIPGFDGGILAMLLNNSYDIPYNMGETNQPETSAYRCVSSANQDGVKLAYTMFLDEDKELVKGSFSASSTTQDKSIVQNAADLFFFAVAIQEYDTSDKDALVAWMEDTVATVDEAGASTTIGDATFFMYSMGRSYYLDVNKAE